MAIELFIKFTNHVRSKNYLTICEIHSNTSGVKSPYSKAVKTPDSLP